ncbi:glycine-rich cell wall structural protein 1.8-like [Amaranthus tricolor]|uniref:glycine-rich cell wall structural protein 1.8-like n=1 Tax=Amaranthus tricolor TaxID=29722 RepID=UPI00258886D6|nr:glycine-rich cell wall structural protein 1.8-like [Amaranthus tricolor]
MSNRQRGTTNQGGGLGAPGTTGAAGARDPLGAPGSTGASRTMPGATGYDPTEYGTEGTGGQAQLHRPETGVDTDVDPTTYTYGTAASMGSTGTGYHSGVHVPLTTGGVTGTYGTSATMGSTGVHVPLTTGVGHDMGQGDRAHGYGGERGGHDIGAGVGYDTGDLLSGDVGGGKYDRGRHGGYDTGGARQRNIDEEHRRG